MITLEDVYRNSNSISNIDLPERIVCGLKKIGEHCYKQKGVYTVTVTLLLYKINHPEQDVRFHQSNMLNGFSGRSFDTQYVTPVLARLGLPAMAESGWLTRSLEQPYPYTLNYEGKISGGLKEDFLQLLDFVEKNPTSAEGMLKVLLNTVMLSVKNNQIIISPLKSPEKLTITKIIQALDVHFNYNYGTHNGAKLPVLAFYALYESLIKEILRYKDCHLAKLASLTACDQLN